MKFARLVVRNLGRNARRTFLTASSIAVSLFLLSFLLSVIHQLDDSSESRRGTNRVVVRHRVSLANWIPEAYGARLRQLPHVSSATIQSWFGGLYKDQAQNSDHRFARFAVEVETWRETFDDNRLPDDQWRDFAADRTGAIAGADLVRRLGWRIGERIPLVGDLYPVSLDLTLRGIYDGPQPDALFFHRRYLEELLGNPGRAGTVWLKVDDAERIPELTRQAEELFANSAAPVKAETESAFRLMFVNMLGNVTGLIRTIGLVVVFSIVLVAANTMAMAVRERTAEVAVLRTLGFRRGQVLGLVLAEASALSTLGGAAGILACIVTFRMVPLRFFGFFRDFGVAPATAAFGLVVSLAIGIAAGGVPAWRASRLDPVRGLRRVG